MTRGRKPASPKVKDLGTRTLKVVGGSDADPVESASEKKKRLKKERRAPAWIKDKEARKCWDRVLPELLTRKQYIALFEAELGRYCVAFGQYVAALKAMDKDKGPVVLSTKNVPMLSQHWVVANRAHETMLRLAADLGLNPVAQNRLAGLQLDLFNTPPAGKGAGGGDGPKGGFAQFRR